MKTIVDIIMMIDEENYCKELKPCNTCSKENFCSVNTKYIALDYLDRGEYYG